MPKPRVVTRVLETDRDKMYFHRFIDRIDMPCTITITPGKRRSLDQNRMQFLWFNEIAQQLGDMTWEEVRGQCKLTLGVPILRAENEAFREAYDRAVKPLSYEQKIALMKEPLDMPVTRLFTKAQAIQYLDAMTRHWAEKGIRLTQPEDLLGPSVGQEKRAFEQAPGRARGG